MNKAREMAEKVMEEIRTNAHDKDSLAEAVGLESPKKLMRIFSNIRFLGFEPVVVDGFYVLMASDEFDEYQEKIKAEKLAARKAKKKKVVPKTPPEIRHKRALAKFNKTFLALQAAKEGQSDTPTERERCMLMIKQMQHRVANIDYNALLDKLKVELELPSKDAVVESLTEEEV